MTPQRRQQLLAGALAVVAVIFVWNRLLPLAHRRRRRRPPAAAGRGVGRRRRPARLQVVELKTDRLRPRRRRVLARPRPVPLLSAATAPAAGPTPEELAARRRPASGPTRRAPPRPPRPADAARNAPPQPPDFQLTYLGCFGPKDRKIAVFTNGDDIYNVLVGDVLEDQFIVSHIGYESVDIKYVDFPDLPAKRLPVGG